MPIGSTPQSPTPSESSQELHQVDPSSEASSPTDTKRGTTKHRRNSNNNNNNESSISELAVHLRELQLENDSQSSEIAHLRRQLAIQSEFKGFGVDVEGRVRLNGGLWEAGNIGDILASGRVSEDSYIGDIAMDQGNGAPNEGGGAAPTESNDPLAESVNSEGGFANQLQKAANKYENYDEAQLKEMAAVVSPKVSELLNEQALALDDLLDTSGWSSSDSEDYSGRKRMGGRRRKNQGGDDDEDSLDDEWNQLEAAQMNLKDELEAATNGFLFDGDDTDAEGEMSKNDSYNEEWRDSIAQYYADNSQSAGHGGNGEASRAFPSRPNHSYTLADHAATLDVSRPISDRGLYVKPLLSQNELETLGVVTLPEWIVRPSGEVSSRGREAYMKRMLNCAVEYIEPPKSKNLRRLFSGWNPGPGERRPGEEGGDDSQHVTAYSPAKSPSHEDGDSDEENNDAFEDIDGMGTAYASPISQRVMEPLPVRTVTIRIRPDVLCGSVLEALSNAVERVGGEMTKRQGGHLRAVLPGRKMRAWKPGEWESAHQTNAAMSGNGELNSGETKHNEEEGTQDDNDDDAASVVSSLSSIISLSSPKPKGPKYEVLPPYIVDAQLVTKKSGKECQRLVLIRIYRMQDVARARATMGEGDNDEALDLVAPLDAAGEEMLGGSPQQNCSFAGGQNERVDPLLESKRSLRSLQEASALVQRIKAVGATGFAIDPQHGEGDAATVSSHTSTKSYLKSFGDAITSPMRYLGGGSSSAISPTKARSTPYPTVMELMSAELLRKHASSPSVGTSSRSALAAAKQKSHGIFPSLSRDDSPFVKSSWFLLRDCIEELDRRGLAYSTLGTSPIFQPPALSTLDVQFIAQIKAFCRESMIVSLVKTASELEVYAREVEVGCGNLDNLLRPTFDMYQLAPPQLPLAVPLTAYPLDFKPPEEMSPPWGPDVMAALEKTSELAAGIMNDNSETTMPLSSFALSEKAISVVVAAFQKQNDVEQGARLGRKNLQVMDRLAKMQAHKRNSIAKIRDSYGSNLLATRAADEFHSLRQKSSNVGSLTDVINSVPDEVPLLVCNVLVGNSAGTCYVTHSNILFNTQLVPILGGSKIHLFSILDVDVTINAPSKSVLSPLPASISFTTAVYGGRRATREEVYNFIPSIGARRFAKFLEVVRDSLSEDPYSLKFSEKGGLIYLAD